MMTYNSSSTRKGKNARRPRTITTTGTRLVPIFRRNHRLACNRSTPFLTILLLSLLSLILTPPHRLPFLFADAFASNLVDTGIGCMTELSTDEVIMNEEVKPPEESDFPKMHLAVLDGNKKPIELESQATPYKYDPTVSTLEIAFVNPYPASEFNDDLQFVLEVQGATEESKDAEFISGGPIGCDNNRRVSGRLLDIQASVVLQINDPNKNLKIWGGWATGHNAVRLVPDLLLQPGEAHPKKEEEPQQEREKEEEALEDLEEELMEEEFKNTDKEKSLREQQEEKLEKLLGIEDSSGSTDSGESEVEDESKDELEELEEELEDLEEELEWAEFKKTDKEKLLREEQEEKLENLLGEDGDPKKEQAQEQRGLPEEDPTTTKNNVLQRKRKNPLEKPGNVPDGLIDPGKRDKDLGLEIARKNRERGQQGSNESNGVAETKTIQQKLKDKQLDLDAHGNNKNNNNNEKKHKLTDHVAGNRDIPETVKIDDDVTNIDSPGGSSGTRGMSGRMSSNHDFELKLVFETSCHFAGCAFFVASMGLFMMVFGKRRDKGRRDL